MQARPFANPLPALGSAMSIQPNDQEVPAQADAPLAPKLPVISEAKSPAQTSDSLDKLAAPLQLEPTPSETSAATPAQSVKTSPAKRPSDKGSSAKSPPAESPSNKAAPDRTAPDKSPPAEDPQPQQNASSLSRFKLPGKLPKPLKRAFWGAVFGVTALTAAGLGAIAVLAFPFPRQISGETVAPPLSDLWRSGFRYQVSRPVNILVMGLDEARDVDGAQPEDLVGRTDTMLLVRVDPEQEVVNILSIPRDTQVEIPGYGVDKINQANFEGGAELAAQTVIHNFNEVEIDRYVRVSTVAFKEIVDLVGGVEVFVPKAMEYEDQTQGLYIDLKPGLQTLDGDEAEQFARFRQDSYGDIGRVQRQQVLLKALRQRITSPAVLPKLPQIIRVLQTHIDTNLSAEEILALAGFGLDLEGQDLQMVMLPGRFSSPEEYQASYWLADQTASSELMRTYFDAQPAELVADAVGTTYYDPPSDRTVSSLAIAVQNATDDPYASYSMAEYLREQGFYNVYVMPDWSGINPETAVVAQRGDLGSAQAVRSALDLGQIVSDSTGDIDSDLTIRVGEDWLAQVDPTWQRLPYDGPR